MAHTPPSYKASAFNCPKCGAYSTHSWTQLYIHGGSALSNYRDYHVSTCLHCKYKISWDGDRIIDPRITSAPNPHPDLPQDLLLDYQEAANIFSDSPRGAAALLRLLIQKLMPFVGGKGKNINTDIGTLVKQGLGVEIQQALDTLRVIGNESVHPGQIDLRDDPATASYLFEVTNFIVDQLITQPRKRAQIYGNLPKPKIAAIEQRDAASFESDEQPDDAVDS